jgi:hypothetical protein
MLRPGLLAVVATVAWASAATAQGDPSAEGARLMAALREASGGPALADAPSGFHATGALVPPSGQAYSYEIWGDFRTLRWVQSTTLGGLTALHGYDGRTAWQEGPDGSVITDTSTEGPAVARFLAYFSVAGYLFQDGFPATFESKGRQELDGARYDVVTVTPADGASIDFWLDAETHLLQRLSGVLADTPFLAVIERYEAVDGVQIPFATRQKLGGLTIEQTVASYELIDVPEERLAPPTP